MVEKFKKHIGYYIVLFLIFGLGLLVTLMASPNSKLQIFTISLTIILYVLWGIFHHFINHELTNKIMIEYILIGSLGLSILFFIMEGGGL